MEQHEIRPHDGRLPAKLLEEGAVDHTSFNLGKKET